MGKTAVLHWGAGVFLLSIGLAAGCSPGAGAPAAGAAPAERPPVPVSVEKARAETLLRRVTAVGSLSAEEEVVVRAEVAGRVTDVFTDRGREIAPGKPLARLDPTDYHHRYSEGRFSLAVTLAKLNLLDPQSAGDTADMPIGAEELASRLRGLQVSRLPVARAAAAEVRQAEADHQDAEAAVREADASVAGAEAELANAGIKLAEAERNRRMGAATQEELNDRRTLRDAAKARLDAAIARAAASKAKVRSAEARLENLKAREAQVADDAAALIAEARRKHALLELTRKALADTSINAPMPQKGGAEAPAPSGRTYTVADRRVAVGDYVEAAGELFRLMLTDPLRLRVTVPERFLSQVQVGQKAEFTVEAYAETFTGTVAAINVVDPVSRNFEVEIRVPNPAEPVQKLKPGTFAKAEILTGIADRAVLVPQEAIITFAGVTKLFVWEGSGETGTAAEVQVALGVGREYPRPDGTVERWVEVRPLAGKRFVKPGETVITSGTGRIAEGSKVQLRK